MSTIFGQTQAPAGLPGLAGPVPAVTVAGAVHGPALRGPGEAGRSPQAQPAPVRHNALS